MSFSLSLFILGTNLCIEVSYIGFVFFHSLLMFVQGIDVFDKEGESLGKSKKAAFYAVGETALSRVINASPIMVIPPLVLMRLQKQNWLRTRPKLTIPVNLGLITLTSLIALPLAIGVFPAREKISPFKLEPQFHHLKDKSDQPIVEVEFNRGLQEFFVIVIRLFISIPVFENRHSPFRNLFLVLEDTHFVIFERFPFLLTYRS